MKFRENCLPRNKELVAPLVRVTGQFIVRLQLFSKSELSIGLEFQLNAPCKSIAAKNIQSDMKYVLKNT